MDFKFLKILRNADANILSLLNHNIIGTPGHGMLYQHLTVEDKIGKIEKPFFVNLARQSTIAGTCCFCHRTTKNNGQELKSFYIRYFSFKDTFRRRILREKKLFRKSILRQEVEQLLNGQSLETSAREKFFHYAYVDPRNIRSAQLCSEFGFETVREYTTVIFSRLNPKPQLSKIEKMSAAEEPQVRQLLSDFYKDYSMFSFENLFNGRGYYVLRDKDGGIVAGVQANPDHWKILSLPGFTGKLILNAFTYLPILNKLVNKHYRFITVEGIYYKKGFEDQLNSLLEHLLHQYRVNSAIMVVDANTALYQDLRKLKLGPVDKLNKEVRGNVICRFINFTAGEKQRFTTMPAYISGIDVT